MPMMVCKVTKNDANWLTKLEKLVEEADEQYGICRVRTKHGEYAEYGRNLMPLSAVV